ncbi:MAG: DMT family transporter [Sphaerobacter sp.]|nr:DMT family transporter [Sphaerobacter sp.]
MGRGRVLGAATESARAPEEGRESGGPSARTLLLVHLSLLFVALSWGSNFVSMKYLLHRLDAAEVLLLRLTLASLCYAAFLLLSGRGFARASRADRGQVVLMALLGVTINTAAVAFGAQLIPAAVGSLIVTGNPIFTAVIARVLGQETLTQRKAAGIAVAFCGFLVVLLYGGPEAQFSVRNALGIGITLIGPLAWALYTVFSKPLLARYEPVQFAGTLTIIGTIPLLPLFLARPGLVQEVTRFGPADWLALTTMVVFALVLGYAFWYRGLRVLSPTQIAIYIYLVPVFGTLEAGLLLGERITAYLLLGGALILLGVIVTNTAPRGPVGHDGRSRGRRTIDAGASRGGHDE